MNLKEFQAALADGSLDIAEVKAHIESLAPAQPSEPEEDEKEETVTALRAALSATNKKMAAIEALLTTFGAKPGEGKATPELPDGDLPNTDGKNSPRARLKKFNEATAAAAAANEPVRFEIGG